MRRGGIIGWAILLGAVPGLACGACGGANGNAGDAAKPAQDLAEIPRQTAAEDEDVDRMLTQLVGHDFCERLEGGFLPLAGLRGGGGGEGEQPPATGRLWMRECSARVDGDRITLELGGPAWKWVDRESEVAGATFGVSQYVRLDTDVQMTGVVDVAYATDEHVATAWFTPVEPIQAAVRPTGDIDVNEIGLWSEVVGGVADLAGREPVERARERIRRRGANQFEAELDHGFTAVVDLCTAQQYTVVRKLAEGVVPDEPVEAQGRLWTANTSVRLHPQGLDADGPFQTQARPLNVEVIVEDGDALRVQLACQSDVDAAVQAFLDLEPVPEIDAKASQVVEAGQSATLEAPTTECPLGLLFTAPDGAEQPVVYRYIVWPEGADRRPLVPCPEQS